MRELLGIAFVLAASSIAQAATLTVDHGNVVIDGKAITSDGHDSDPLLSPDGQHVVFDRHSPTPPRTTADCLDDNNQPERATVSLWEVNTDGTHATKLLAGGDDTARAEALLCDFTNKQFDSTGRLLYFETPAWATSDAIHVLDMTTRKERFFAPGNSLLVLATCKDEQYRDDVVASEHRYFVYLEVATTGRSSSRRAARKWGPCPTAKTFHRSTRGVTISDGCTSLKTVPCRRRPHRASTYRR